MPTKLSRFCLGVMEAAWLAAVSVIPIFFNIYSSRIFEPDKITILRSLAILTLVAWIIKLVEEGGVKWKAEQSDQSLFMYLLKYPLVVPVVGLAIVYILSTIFSVTPTISLFGSYQRLQGTYTTFSYLVIFFSIIANLRQKEQINRLITTVIFASLPISLYGLLQHYGIDPIPWGGNVSIRIAANMGNSIFVAAYLIMVFPLTVGRIIRSFTVIVTDHDSENSDIHVSKHIILATIYVIIAALQLIAIYMSGSRGPLLGWLVAGFFMLLLYSIYWRARWLSFSIIGLAVVGLIFLAVFNMRGGPLDALKKSPAVGRFGNLLNPESNSALVRQYIWEGTVKLVSPHAPLVFPDGSTDKLNFLRPFIGYGPESMYVAYNQFYQPELGQVEKRNASPDRSHNETWDSIVITGALGLLVYLSIFSTIFYYGLKWQGLINTRGNKVAFFTCLFGGGVIGSVALIALKGIEYLGVGLPFGMVAGVVVYLAIYALFFARGKNDTVAKNPYLPLLIVLFSAIIGHFVEINFGIAIVATRTLFWIYTGTILVVGYVLPKSLGAETQPAAAEVSHNQKVSTAGRKKEYLSAKQSRKADHTKRWMIGDRPDWFRNALVGAVIVGLILATLGFDYITNSTHTTSFLEIFMTSLSRLEGTNNVISLGIVVLLVFTWLLGAMLYTAESGGKPEERDWLKTFGLMVGIALGIGILFWLWHSLSLASLAAFIPKDQIDVKTQVSSIGALLTNYYIYVLLILAVMAYLLPDDWPVRSTAPSYIGAIAAPFMAVLLFAAVNWSNLHVIQADITFKMAEPFTKSGQWQVATYLYQNALELAPKEDHYYLFLGRSYLETAKITEAVASQDKLVSQAESDLQTAQKINPLNTDHTANLARLFTWWAGKATTAEDRSQRAAKASEYYATALELSPNNSTLWDEWAVLAMQLMNQPDQALNRLQHALSLDQKYNYTQGLLGDYYMRIASTATDQNAKLDALQKAEDYYKAAVAVTRYTDTNSKASYLVSLSNVYLQRASLDPSNIDRNQIQQAITVLEQSINSGLSSNDLWKVQEALAKLYFQMGDKAKTQYYAKAALAGAPDTAINRIQTLITQTESLP